MAERSKHLFQFKASDIAKAARTEGLYHFDRLSFWKKELAKSMDIVRETARIEFVEQPITGGSRLDVIVKYGDPAAYQRMHEAQGKIEHHTKSGDRFAMDATLYGTQNEVYYQLDADDVAHFRLNGIARGD